MTPLRKLAPVPYSEDLRCGESCDSCGTELVWISPWAPCPSCGSTIRRLPRRKGQAVGDTIDASTRTTGGAA